MRDVLTDAEKARGERIEAGRPDAPVAGANLWRLTETTSNTQLYLLGTVHGDTIGKLVKRGASGSPDAYDHSDERGV